MRGGESYLPDWDSGNVIVYSNCWTLGETGVQKWYCSSSDHYETSHAPGRPVGTVSIARVSPTYWPNRFTLISQWSECLVLANW